MTYPRKEAMAEIDDRPPEQPVISSYVHHGAEVFFVSTIARNSSAVAAPDYRYHETIVWEWLPSLRQQGAMLHTSSSGLGSLSDHFRICEAFYRIGSPPEETE